jgi:hypothetical protein
MTGSEQHLVLLEKVLKIIFKLLDPIWLAQMWRGLSESHRDMIDIIFMLYLLKCRLWLLLLVTLRPLVLDLYYFDDWSFDRILRALADLCYDDVLVHSRYSCDCGFLNVIFILKVEVFHYKLSSERMRSQWSCSS